MSPLIASALRRAAVAGGILAATLIGHALTTGGAEILPVAPFLWMGLLSLVLLSGAGRRASDGFRAWGPARLLVTLVLGQGALHLLLHGAPWALGLGIHHEAAALVSVTAVVVHLGIALLLLVVLSYGQAALVRTLAIARALLAPERPRPVARPMAELPRDLRTATSQWRRGPGSTRGPPAPALAWAGPGRVAATS